MDCSAGVVCVQRIHTAKINTDACGNFLFLAIHDNCYLGMNMKLCGHVSCTDECNFSISLMRYRIIISAHYQEHDHKAEDSSGPPIC